MISYRKFIAAVVGTSLMLFAPAAAANNGAEIGELTRGVESFFVSCLGEYVGTTVNISYRYHEFETPSGKYHFVDNWRYTVEIRGESGNVWFGRGASPSVLNVGPGMTLQFGESLVAVPVTGKGPKLRVFNGGKVTVNANGDLVVENFTFDPENPITCFGKPQPKK